MANKTNLPFTSPKLDPYIKKLTEFGIENGQDKVKGYPKKKENKQPSLPGVNWEYTSWGDEQTERLTEPTKAEVEKRIATMGDPKSNGVWKRFVDKNKGSPVVAPFFPDTKAGVDHFTKTLKEDQNTTPAKEKEIDKLGLDMKKNLVDYHGKQIKPFDQFDKNTYPSNAKQRGHLLELDKLEKDVKGYSKLGDPWRIIKESMTPIERGQWSREQFNKKQEKLKDNQETLKTIPDEVNKIMRKEIDDIVKSRVLLETVLPAPRTEYRPIRKKEQHGLHGNHLQDKLVERQILKEIEDEEI